MLLIGVAGGCLQSLAVLQKAPAVPKVDLTVQTVLQGGDAAVQGVLVSPAVVNAQLSSHSHVKKACTIHLLHCLHWARSI